MKIKDLIVKYKDNRIGRWTLWWKKSVGLENDAHKICVWKFCNNVRRILRTIALKLTGVKQEMWCLAYF